jgi:hypothetical protein
MREKLAVEVASKDPRAKYHDSKYIRIHGRAITGDQRRLWKLKFVQCYQEYKELYFPDQPDDFVPAQRTAASVFLSISQGFNGGIKPLTHVDPEIPLEVQHYLDDANVGRTVEMDPLAWWKANASQYPVLAKMAGDILPIQPSAVEMEHVHSGGRTVLNFNQSRMGPEAVSGSVILKCFSNYNGVLGGVEDTLAQVPIE